MVLYYHIMRKIEIDNVEAMFEKEVDKTGRVSGLKQWEGKKVIILVVKE
jgi:putative transposon-encoded protein